MLIHESKTHPSGQFPSFCWRSINCLNSLTEIKMAQHMLKPLNVLWHSLHSWTSCESHSLTAPVPSQCRVQFIRWFFMWGRGSSSNKPSDWSQRRARRSKPRDVPMCRKFPTCQSKGKECFYVSDDLLNLHKKDAQMTSWRKTHGLSSQKQTTDLASPKTGAQVITWAPCHIQKGTSCSSNPSWFQPGFPLVADRFPGELTWFP